MTNEQARSQASMKSQQRPPRSPAKETSNARVSRSERVKTRTCDAFNQHPKPRGLHEVTQDTHIEEVDMSGAAPAVIAGRQPVQLEWHLHEHVPPKVPGSAKQVPRRGNMLKDVSDHDYIKQFSTLLSRPVIKQCEAHWSAE